MQLLWRSGSAVDASGTERADVPGMRCCCSCFGANGAARCDGVALVLMQAGRVSPARSSDASLVNFRPHRRCCEHRYRRKWLYLRRACAVPSSLLVCCWCARNRVADPRAQHASVGRGTERADVPGMRCCCSCFGANGAAALVLMQAALSELMCLVCGTVAAALAQRLCC